MGTSQHCQPRQHRRHRSLAALLGVALAAPLATAHANPLDVRLNQVQVLGTHNSYHIQPEQRILNVLGAFDPSLPIGLAYTHIPLDQQFSDQGIRQIELDVFADPLGGLYAERKAYVFFGEDPASGLPELDEPGFKVLHVQDVDFNATCFTLVSCLQIVKDWSDAHPDHLPIMILIEAKDDVIPDPLNLGFAIPIPIGAAELDDLDLEIRSVLPADKLITPDDVRGSFATLEEAVLSGEGWPTLLDARGKILFALDNGGSVRAAYESGHPSLTGRVMFTDAPPGSAEAAFLKINGPVGNEDQIADYVAAGYIIRTRADADTIEARIGSTERRDIALASGAQFISTDYPVPNPAFGTGYFVEIPDGAPGRCNPVNAPFDCLSATLERLDGFREVAGRKLVLRDRGETRRKLLVEAADGFIALPEPGSFDEPTTAGATVVLSNPATGEIATFDLPAGPAWTALGSPAGRSGYRYLDPDGTNGPCKSLRMVRGARKLRISCVSKNAPIPFSLDELLQGSLAVTVRLGAGDVYCMSFGGVVRTDRERIGNRAGAFIAVDAPPGGCPLP